MLVGSAVVGQIPSSLFLPGVFVVLVGMILYPTFHEVFDIEADRRAGCKTIAMILNQRRRLELSTSSLLMIMITVTLTYGYFGLNVISPILTVFACLLFLRYIFPLLMKPEETFGEEVLEKCNSIFRAFTLIVPLGFILGSL